MMKKIAEMINRLFAPIDEAFDFSDPMECMSYLEGTGFLGYSLF